MEITSQELMKMMENNELLAKDFLPKFAIAMRASVREGDALNKMMQGTQSQMGRFGNAINDAAMAFSRGGFNKAFLEFLAQATKSMNAMIKSGFFDALGFGFRMLMMPIRATMEVVGGLSDIFKRAVDEGGEYRDILIMVSSVLTLLLLPTLVSIGRTLAPLLLLFAGIMALGDTIQALAGNSSELKTNWDALTQSIKDGKTDWEALGKIIAQISLDIAAIVVGYKFLRKGLGLASGKAPSTGSIEGSEGGGKKRGGKFEKLLGASLIYPLMDAGLDLAIGDTGFAKWAKETTLNDVFSNSSSETGVQGRVAKVNAFDRNAEMIEKTNRMRESYAAPLNNNDTTSKSIIISNMNINGESAPEDLRTNMESYMNNLLGDVFTDAMRETVR